jgi:hypothetical protein
MQKTIKNLRKAALIALFRRFAYIHSMAEPSSIDFLQKFIYIDSCRDIGNKCVVLPQWTETKGVWSYLSGQIQKVRGPALVDNFKRLQSLSRGCNLFYYGG